MIRVEKLLSRLHQAKGLNMVFKVKPAKCRSSLTHLVAIKRKRLHFERLEERRVLAAGDVDLTFGTQGFATAEFYESRTWGNMLTAVALQPDGKLVAAGGGTAVRYMADGTLDDTFGIGGRLPIPMDARAIALQADGKIWLAGGTDDALSRDFVLARLIPSGSLDASFADKGLQRVDFGSNEEMAHAMVLDSSGRILLAGGSGKRVALTRLRDNGSLDSTFSQDGLFTTQFSLQDVAYAIALQASGRIVVAGSSFISSTTTPLITTNYDAFVMKLFPSGALDNSLAATVLSKQISCLPLFRSTSPGTLPFKAMGRSSSLGKPMVLATRMLPPPRGTTWMDRWIQLSEIKVYALILHPMHPTQRVRSAAS